MDADAVEAKAPGELRDVALPEVVHVEEEREERGVAALHVRGEVRRVLEVFTHSDGNELQARSGRPTIDVSGAASFSCIVERTGVPRRACR
jgi:hypothetical protein